MLVTTWRNLSLSLSFFLFLFLRLQRMVFEKSLVTRVLEVNHSHGESQAIAE